MKTILASQSKARKKLLSIFGIKFNVIPSNIDEKAIRHEDPLTQVKHIAEAKARAIGEKNPDSIIIGGDTIVFCNKKVLEKPKDKQEAKQMLNQLSGRTFEVISGVAVYNSKTKTMYSDADSFEVTFRNLTEEEIKDYSSRYDLTLYAGAFEDDGFQRFALTSKGSPSTLVGLPLQKLIILLRENGINL